MQRDGGETEEIAKRWITAHAQQPFFYFLHLYEPHTPYDPPEPYRSRYPSKYDGEIARTDAIVGDFISFLKANGVYDKAVILLLSDHGEGLHDHGEAEHGIFVYREALQVPLMLKLSQQRERGKSVATPVQLSDVFPTICAITATAAPQTALENRLRRRIFRRHRPQPHRPPRPQRPTSASRYRDCRSTNRRTG